MFKAALRAPAASGLNVTETVQRARAAKLVPQVVVVTKSALFTPETVIELIFIELLNGAVRVTCWPVLVVPRVCGAKVKVLGETVAKFSIRVRQFVLTRTSLIRPAE